MVWRGDYMLNYVVSGNKNGNPIIFVNGAGVGPWMWDNQIRELKSYNCITFDLPGHGDNSDQIFISVEACTKEINEIVHKEFGKKKYAIVGHSIGAQIVMNLLNGKQENISHAVIISGLNKPMKNMKPLMNLLIDMTMPLIKLKWFSKLQAKELSLPEKFMQTYYKDSKKISKESLKNILAENMSFKINNDIDTDIKTLVLVGSNEKKLMLESAKKSVQLFKQSKGFIINNAAHGIPYERPVLFNKLLSSFLEDADMNYDSDALVELNK